MHPPFIATQRLWRLDCPPNFQWDCLAADPLGVLPDDGNSTGVQRIPVHGLPSGECRWELINPASPAGPNRPADPARQRREFLGDMSVTRLCVTIDAGVGKTTALKQMQCLRQTGVNGDCLAMLLQFAGLPTEANGIPKLLMEQLRNTPRTRTLAAGELWNLIERLIRRQGFTLLVDALDQSLEADSAAKQSCRALRDFLVRYPEVRCVVSGRPYAIRRYWDLLFEPLGTWRFVKVDVFTHDECRQFVGPERLAHLTRLGADVIAVPRALEMIQQIPVKFLSSLSTKSDVYRRSLEGMLEEALKNQADQVGLPLHQTRRLFALLAFEMLRCGYRAGEAGIKGGEDVTSFMARILAAQGPLLRSWLDIEKRTQLEQHLVQLLAVNEILADPVLAGHGRPEIVQFLWRNQALMDMFAALWLTRYASEQADYRWFHQQLGERASRELCQLAVEMPLAEPKSTYVKAMSLVINDAVPPREALPQRRRWTEWIYRSWPNLLQIAGYLSELDWTDSQLKAATWAAQREARRYVELNRDLSDANTARELLLQFLGEFPLIARGSRGTTAQRVAEELERGLVRVPPDDSCSRTGPGSERKGTLSVEIEPLLLGAMPVTNAQYELFDPAHQHQRGEASPDDTCPVVEVSWYDAWCYAVWVGGRLPTDEEWGRACRAGSAGAWCFGDDDRRLKDYAWYSGNMYSHGVDHPIIRPWYGGNADGHTHPVGVRTPNIWGLYDMHGNVWEWCDSWYDGRTMVRVFRGGSWKSPLEECRSASRNGSSPSFRSLHVGFRVAADLLGRQVQPGERP